LVRKMKSLIYLPKDEILRQGDNANSVYFISKGKVEIYIGRDGD
jgi:CRP-like cAMP-binding protein